MSKLNITFYNLPIKVDNGKERKMTLSTEVGSATVGIGRDVVRRFTFSLIDIRLVKQMYMPAEVIATINITKAGDYDWPDRRTLKEVFSHRQVKVVAVTKEDILDREDLIGEDYYVHEVIPVYMYNSMEVKLKIYSPDKLMTLRKACRSYVGKRLGEDILSNELGAYIKPYKVNEGSSQSLSYNTEHMKILRYESTKEPEKTEEHMFPYLVQYNESFYDLLARTTNRWGEFMFWEDGGLQIGYNENYGVEAGKYYKLTYPSLNAEEELRKGDMSGKPDYEAVYEKSMTKPYEYSPWKSHHLVFKEVDHLTKRVDVFAMRKMAALLNNDKSIPTFLGEQAVDMGVSLYYHEKNYKHLNNKLNAKYFPNSGELGLPEQNDDRYDFNTRDNDDNQEDDKEFYKDDGEPHKAYNEFTELETSYDSDIQLYTAEEYGKILNAEQEASKNVALIDYDTMYPAYVKLGAIMDINGELFIVTGISAQTVKEGNSSKLVFSLEVTGQNEDQLFYPAYLPSGHVRLSGPQRAKVVETEDPRLENRVRVKFTWQKDDPEAVATPWIPFSASGDGAATTGRHTKDLDVIVGYIGGNIERPYVMGAIQENGSLIGATDVDMDTPWGHHLRLSDGIGNGFEKFVAGTLSPLSQTILNMCPGFPRLDFKRQRSLEGGFTLSDYYGVYSISGSTENRNISIKSPWGDVKISAFTGITIDAPNGDVKIKGKNITLEAGNNLKLVSGANIKKYFFGKSVKSGFLDVPTAAAAKVLKMAGGLIDFSVLRAAVEVAFRPVEGVLEIQSNRYLKLEAGGSSTGYPDEAYKDVRAMAYAKMKAKDWYKMGPSIADLTKMMRHFVSKWVDMYKTRYDQALKERKALDGLIKELRYYSNVGGPDYDNEQVKICNGYEELKGKLCNKDTKYITDKDLGFSKDYVGSLKNEDVNVSSLARTGNSAGKIRQMRIVKKAAIVKKANELLKAIQTLRKMELTEDEVHKTLGLVWRLKKRLPKNYVSAVTKAFSKKNCEKSSLYTNWVGRETFELTDEEYRGLTETFMADKALALSRLAALNLLDEFGFKAKNPEFGAGNNANAAGNNNIPQGIKLPDLFASEEELINSWGNKLENLKILSTAGTGLEKKIGDFKQAVSEKLDDLSFKKVRERNIWSDAKEGKILFSSGKTAPHSLDGQINDVVAFYSKGKLHSDDVLESDREDIKQFNRTVLDALKSDTFVRPMEDGPVLLPRAVNHAMINRAEVVVQPAEGNQHVAGDNANANAGANPQAANAGANPQPAVPPQREDPNQHIIDDEDFVISVR